MWSSVVSVKKQKNYYILKRSHAPLYTGAAASSHGLALFIAEQQLEVKRRSNKHLRSRPLWFLSLLQAAAQTVGVIKAAVLLFIVTVMIPGVAHNGLHLAPLTADFN